MKIENVQVGENVVVDLTSSINNINLGNGVRVAKRCSLFGSPKHILKIGDYSYIGMNSLIEGFNEDVTIGTHVSIAPNVSIISGSGPNASAKMQLVMPIVRKAVFIGDHTWIGAGAVIMPGVTLGDYCVVAVNSVVNNSFPSFSIIGGAPAKVIREFTDEERNLILCEGDNYEVEYTNLQFEKVLQDYRYQKIVEVVEAHPHKRILEIGSGPTPLFAKIKEFEKMTVIEPLDAYFKEVQSKGVLDKRLTFIHDYFENVVDTLVQDSFDIVIIGGFLHEIDNPDKILQAIKRVCSPNTLVHSYVPNARSFHRLLAFEMGIIDSLYQMSDNDILFKRRIIFDQKSFNHLFATNGFEALELGSYFIKPFSHQQMHELIFKNIVPPSVMDGLNRMISHLPDLGAELFFNGKIKK